MPRFKLANGGVIASCKQPLQKRDFDRIVFEGNQEVEILMNPYDGLNDYPNIKLINPSSHLLQKCYNEANNNYNKISTHIYVSLTFYRGVFDNYIDGRNAYPNLTEGRYPLYWSPTARKRFFKLDSYLIPLSDIVNLRPGVNNISFSYMYYTLVNSNNISDMSMIRNEYEENGIYYGVNNNKAYRKTIDRLIFPENYIDFWRRHYPDRYSDSRKLEIIDMTYSWILGGLELSFLFTIWYRRKRNDSRTAYRLLPVYRIPIKILK